MCFSPSMSSEEVKRQRKPFVTSYRWSPVTLLSESSPVCSFFSSFFIVFVNNALKKMNHGKLSWFHWIWVEIPVSEFYLFMIWNDSEYKLDEACSKVTRDVGITYHVHNIFGYGKQKFLSGNKTMKLLITIIRVFVIMNCHQHHPILMMWITHFNWYLNQIISWVSFHEINEKKEQPYLFMQPSPAQIFGWSEFFEFL